MEQRATPSGWTRCRACGGINDRLAGRCYLCGSLDPASGCPSCGAGYLNPLDTVCPECSHSYGNGRGDVKPEESTGRATYRPDG